MRKLISPQSIKRMKNHLSVSVTYLKAILYQLESNEHGHAVILEVHTDHSQPSFLYKLNLNSLFFPLQFVFIRHTTFQAALTIIRSVGLF